MPTNERRSTTPATSCSTAQHTQTLGRSSCNSLKPYSPGAGSPETTSPPACGSSASYWGRRQSTCSSGYSTTPPHTATYSGPPPGSLNKCMPRDGNAPERTTRRTATAQRRAAERSKCDLRPANKSMPCAGNAPEHTTGAHQRHNAVRRNAVSATCDRPRADGARAQHAAGPSRVRWPAVCGRTPAQSHCQSPLCREARPPSLCLVAKPRAQGTGPDWGRLVFHPGLPHLPFSRGRRAGPWGEGARSSEKPCIKTHTRTHTY